MYYFKITKILALIIGVEACLVMAGWIFGIDALTRVSTYGINMKFPTALVFLFSAIGLYYIVKRVENNDELSRMVLPGIALFVFLIMSALLVGGLSGGQTGIESLFTQQQSSVNALGSGWPSLPSMVSFILFGLAGLFCLFPDFVRSRRLKFFGYPILIIGSIAAIGYILRLPFLYYQFDPFSVSMALNTAVAFVLLGLGLVIISQAKTFYEA